MRIDIQSFGFPVTDAMTDHARRRLRFVMTRHRDRIQHVVVHLGDENGRRSVDKFCRIQVYLFDAPVVVVEDIGVDLYAVIDRASDRVGRVIVRHLDRSRIGRQNRRGDALTPPPDAFDDATHAAHSG